MPKPPRRKSHTFDATDAIRQAVAFHQQGKLSEAERLYRDVLAARPGQFDSLHLLGVLRAQQGRAQEAVTLISQALQSQPGSAEARSNLGNAYAALGKLDEALANYDAALALKPEHADTLLNRGITLARLNRDQEALENYDRLIAAGPGHVDALYNRGAALAKLNRLEEAIASYDQALALKPGHATAHYNRGNALARLNRHEEAAASFRSAVAARQDYVLAFNNLGTSLAILERHQEAVAAYDRILALRADDVDAIYNRGVALGKLGRHDEAIASYDRALAVQAGHVDALNNRGVALAKLGRHDEAIASYDRALAVQGGHVDAINNRGTSLQAQGRTDEALACYDKALTIAPARVDVLNNRGTVLARMGRQEEAIACYAHVLAIEPRHADALYGTGNVLQQLHRNMEAISSYNRCLEVDPARAEALFSRGNVQYTLRRLTDAVASYRQAIAVKPGYADALNNLGNVLQETNRHEEAIESFEQVLALQPDHGVAYGSLAYSWAHICDWRDRQAAERRLAESAAAGRLISVPYLYLALSHSAADQFACTTRFARDCHPAITPPMWQGERYRHDRIRIAYLSSDLHDHATAYLMAELFEKHDRTRFEVTAISFGPDRDSAMRTRLKNAFERFVDVRQSSARDTAQQVRDLEIDIAVDLKGYTTNSRPEIFAHRPAPIQVNYLGYPGTMGVDYIDYIIGDPVVIPQAHFPCYTEKIVQLPDCYQVNDSRRAISDHTPTRAEAGLPERGFVFCSFNNNYKIGPMMFDVWMRLLRQVEGSVLWLLEGNPVVADNLRREASARGVAPERLVFARRAKLADHLARHRLADLFLDTLPYNAHTTASDALWAGLPLVTLIGTTFPGRVAASLLSAMRLPELITHSIADYEALALKLAVDPGRLRNIGDKLAANRLNTPLFDTGRFARHIEAAYTTMWEIHQRGEPPKAFAVCAETGKVS